MSAPSPPGGRASEGTFQRLIEDIYFDRDSERGTDKTLLILAAERGFRDVVAALTAAAGAPRKGMEVGEFGKWQVGGFVRGVC